MGIDISELRKKLEDQAFRLESAKANRTMVNQETERTKNILLNNLSDIVAALKMAEHSAEEIKMLEAEVESADAELKELDDEIKKLRKTAPKQQAAKTAAEKAEPDVK